MVVEARQLESSRNEMIQAAGVKGELKATRRLIITADDFGLHERVNLAVEWAHQHGVLTAASLMVGAPAARDAVERARALPDLRVGLHLVLADGAALTPRALIPALVDREGRFGNNMVLDGVRFFLLPHVRRQLTREIRAQFDAFEKTGLTLDHVNTHKHFHLHPTVLRLILEIGRDYGMRAMRLPYEVSAEVNAKVSAKISAKPDARVGGPLWLKPWITHVCRQLDRAGIAHNDYVVGIAGSGRMDEATWLAALAGLPEGVGEIYCHPAIAGEGPLSDGMRDYRHADELHALLSPRVAAALCASGAKPGGFGDLF